MANTQNLDLVKPLGTDYALVSVLNSNSDKIDAYAGAVNASLDGLRDGLGILANGNTHAAITSGQYVYVKNHGSLPEGLYKATANIAANGTLSTTNLAADSAGGLNSLNEQIGNLKDNNIIPTLNTLKYTQFGKLIIVGGYFTGNGTATINTGMPSNYIGCIPVRDATAGTMSLYYHNNAGQLRGWDGSSDRVFETNHTYQMIGILYKE